MPIATPLLLHFRVSHYNEKVRWALDHKRLPHRREALVPGFHVPRVRLLTGQNKVPVLVLDGEPICGSASIIERLERLQPDPPLFPDGAAERDRALAIAAYFDDEVAPDVRRLFWSKYLDRPADCARMATMGCGSAKRALWRSGFSVMRPLFRRNIGLDDASLARAETRLAAHFDRLEAEIGPHGRLVGDRFGVADLTAASIMTALIRPPQFPYPLPEPWPPALIELRRSVAHRRGFRWVLDVYERHRGGSAELAT
jgi:glutathione S-transferase